MGYDYMESVAVGSGGLEFLGKARKTKDTALLSRKERGWIEEGKGAINFWEDFIEDVKIDAFHSFQDTIIPVGEFKRRYGDRIAAFGTVDMDKLCRLDERSLRKYVRNILDECMPDRYALGSGNTIANYVPVENYLIMLDEEQRWGDS